MYTGLQNKMYVSTDVYWYRICYGRTYKYAM